MDSVGLNLPRNLQPHELPVSAQELNPFQAVAKITTFLVQHFPLCLNLTPPQIAARRGGEGRGVGRRLVAAVSGSGSLPPSAYYKQWSPFTYSLALSPRLFPPPNSFEKKWFTLSFSFLNGEQNSSFELGLQVCLQKFKSCVVFIFGATNAILVT